MMYKTGDKIEIKNVDFVIEILAIYPASQNIDLKKFLGDTNCYRVFLDGHKTFMSEEVLKVFVESMKAKAEEIEADKRADKKAEEKTKGGEEDAVWKKKNKKR